MKAMLMLITIMSMNTACAQTAKYYRVWQGFKNPALSSKEFINQLPTFMEETVELYRDRALNNYFVGLPPKNRPNFIPDEFALVALKSEKDYSEIRKTPAGKKYSARHWDLFNRENSKSAPLHNFKKEKIAKLEHNHAYDMFGEPLDWTTGTTTFYIGTRKKDLSAEEFLTRLHQHIQLTKKTFSNFGLRGYILIANKNYEVAYMNWNTRQQMLDAFKSLEGKAVIEDAGKSLNLLQYQESTDFHPIEVQDQAFIKTIF